MMRGVLAAMAMLLTLTLGGCANSLFYFPDRKDYEAQVGYRIPHEDVWINTTDGLRLHGWFLKATGEAKGTVVFLHGNAQNLTAHVLYVSWLPAEHYNVLIADYRGYGMSFGSATRRGVYDDARAMWSYARTRPDVDPQKMILFGQSLGGANALALAGREQLPGLRAVIADSAFSSYGGIGREKILQVPVLGYLLWPFSPLIVSPGLSPAPENVAPVPLLIIHGDRDSVVPYSHGQRLYAAAHAPKFFWTLEGGQHTEAFARYAPVTVPRLLKFLDYALTGDIARLDPADRSGASAIASPARKSP
ncbi:MAG TPA: alpha/beta hydrolase [Moraxellaceae bacterium]|nr:alpha/beta hydrolase [Moraxellaceae bacterium]